MKNEVAVKQEPGSVKQEPGSVKQEPGSVKQEPGSVKQEPEDKVKQEVAPVKREKFRFLNRTAFLHSRAVKLERENRDLLTDLGPCRRALVARRDLHMRRMLCGITMVSSCFICMYFFI